MTTWTDSPRRSVTAFGWQSLSTVLRFAFSFEVLFTLFLFAGTYKAAPSLSWIPVDLTALTFGLSILVALYILVRRGIRFERRALTLGMIFLVFVIYGLFSLAWTPSDFYAKEKAYQLATLTFWALAATAIIIAFSRRRIHRFLLALTIFASWITFEAVVAFWASGITFEAIQDYEGSGGGVESSTVAALGAYYLGVGRVVGAGALIALAYALFWASSRLLKVGALALFGFFVYALLIIGGRGPLIATLLPAILPVLVGWRFSVARGVLVVKRYFVFLVTLVALGVVAVVTQFGTISQTPAVSRLLVALQPGMEASSAARVGYYRDTIPLWADNPIFGYGVGSWPVVIGIGDVRMYVHNIFLEIMFELGLIGLLLFIGLLAYALRSLGPWRLIRNDPLRVLVLMLLINAFVNVMVTGDLNYNRAFFAVVGLMLLGQKDLLRARYRSPRPPLLDP